MSDHLTDGELGHCHLGFPRSGKPVHFTGQRSVRHRVVLRGDDLGLRRHHHQHQPGS